MLPPPPPETCVHQLFASLIPPQRAAICFPWGHPLQGAVNNNWLIVKRRIKEVLSPVTRRCDGDSAPFYGNIPRTAYTSATRDNAAQ